MAIEIIPAIMPDSLDDLTAALSKVRGLVRSAQIDVMDGIFVASKSWPYVENGPQEFAKITREEAAFPYWQEFDFEVDLMVQDPRSVVLDWVRAGMKRIIVHVESISDFGSIVSFLREKFSSGKEFDVEVTELGIAINTVTPNEKLNPYLDSVDFVQFMGIEKVGYQGQPFDERVVGKIKALREVRSDIIISVDGGVSLETAPKLIEAGANRLVSGSAIFGSGDIRETIKKFEDLKV